MLPRPPPKKKPAGRPMKPYMLEKAYEDMNKCHDFWKMVDHYKSYDLQVKSYVNPYQTLTSVIRVTPVDVLPIKKRLRCVYTTPLLEISMTQQELLTRMNPNNSFKEAELSRCWATFELSCRIRRPAYKMDPCFTGFEFSSVYFSPSGESKESHTTW